MDVAENIGDPWLITGEVLETPGFIKSKIKPYPQYMENTLWNIGSSLEKSTIAPLRTIKR